MEIKNKLTVTREEGREGIMGKEVEGASRGPSMKDPWAWTTGKRGVGRTGESNGGK